MQLNEILEENTIKSISQKTKISEDNLENLLARNFDVLMKIKTLGFISIIEREYQADLNALREEALAYYASHKKDHTFSVAVPMEEEKKGKSKLFLVVVLALLGYASWYFFTQFDKKHLSGLIPFKNQQMIENIIGVENEEEKENLPVEDLSIESAVNSTTKVITEESIVENTLQETNQTNTAMTKEVNETAVPVSQF
jgi:cytoskeletal protein RodZ